MITIKYFVLTAAAAVFLAACGSPAGVTNVPANGANNANASNTNAKPVAAAAAPTKEALLALEKQGWEAWKNKDSKPSEELLSAHYVGFSSTGRVDKAGSMKNLTDQNCEVKSYALSDEKMDMIGTDVAVLTFKADQDYTCGGKKGAPQTWSSSVYAREGDEWKNVLYAESPVIDPKAPPEKAAAPAPDTKPSESKPDALTDSLMAIETNAWDAWKKRDANAVEQVMAAGFMSNGGTGRYDRAESIKQWSVPKCEGLAYTFSDPQAVSIAKDVAFVTYKADVKGNL